MKRHRAGRCLQGLAVILAVGGAMARSQDAAGFLTVSGEVKTPLRLDLEQLAALHPVKLTATDGKGELAEFTGVELWEILERAGVPLGLSLRGEAASRYVVVVAADGYQVVFSLPELDPAFQPRKVVLAYQRDGKPMTEPEGPLRLVIPEEGRHVRWVRMVSELRVNRAPEARPDAGRGK